MEYQSSIRCSRILCKGFQIASTFMQTRGLRIVICICGGLFVALLVSLSLMILQSHARVQGEKQSMMKQGIQPTHIGCKGLTSHQKLCQDELDNPHGIGTEVQRGKEMEGWSLQGQGRQKVKLQVQLPQLGQELGFAAPVTQEPVVGSRRTRSLQGNANVQGMGHHPHPEYTTRNMFTRLIWEYAKIANVNNCWICAHMPFDAHAGMPMIAIPWTTQDHWLDNERHMTQGKWKEEVEGRRPAFYFSSILLSRINGEYYNLKNPITMRLAYAPKGIICFKSSNQESDLPFRMVGESTCNFTFPEAPWRNITGLFPKDYAQFAQGGLTTTEGGAYFVCGDYAYKILPPNWEGTCYISWIIPAIRHVSSLTEPTVSSLVRRKRSHKQYINHPNAKGVVKEVFGAIFPWIGTTMNREDIRKLSISVQSLADDVADALEIFNTEVKAIRELALQNRLALDFLLAKEGGTCAVLKVECCHYIPGNFSQVTKIIQHIRKTSEELDRETPQWSLWDWASNKMGGGSSWYVWILQAFLAIVGTLLFIYVIFAIVRVCVVRCMTAEPVSSSGGNGNSIPLMVLDIVNMDETQLEEIYKIDEMVKDHMDDLGRLQYKMYDVTLDAFEHTHLQTLHG